jgi:hypothetical protein
VQTKWTTEPAGWVKKGAFDPAAHAACIEGLAQLKYLLSPNKPETAVSS